MARRGKARAAMLMAKNAPRKKTKCILARYTRLEALFEMIELGGVPLYGMEHWDDECDKAFVRRGCAECGVTENECGIICFSKAREDEVGDAPEDGEIWPRETSAHWLLNDKPVAMDDPHACLGARIRIEFKANELLNPIKDELKSSQSFGNAPAWLSGEMDYKDFQGYLASAESNLNASWFFHKRESYYWESEWRLIALKQTIGSEKAKKVGARGFLQVAQGENPSRWNEVIKRVVFSPYSSAKGSSKKLGMEKIRSYAERALEFYCIGRQGWTEEKKNLVHAFWAEKRGYRSGILDNAKVLAAATRK